MSVQWCSIQCWNLGIYIKKGIQSWELGVLGVRGQSENLLFRSQMPYPLPTVTLKLYCEQFWTFIVKVTFDLLRRNTQAQLIYR